MQCTLLGTGTSHGIPVIGCSCPCCTSSDARDKRFRSSLWVTDGDTGCDSYTSIIIDTGPEFRVQALKFGIKKLDAVFLTHGHADHLNGLDDVRIFSYTCTYYAPESDGTLCFHTEGAAGGLPVYGNAQTIEDVHERFSYIFKPVIEGGGRPNLHTAECSSSVSSDPIRIGSLSVSPVPMKHGTLETTGWLISNGVSSAAYLTDCSSIPDASVDFLKSQPVPLEHVIIDGLRRRPHSTHLSFDEALSYAARIGAKHSWLTHICHDMNHEQISSYIRDYIAAHADMQVQARAGKTAAPAYDGLVLQF